MSKIDWKHVGEDSLATAIGIVLGGGLLVGLSFVAIKILGKFGVPVYNSLTSQNVHDVYAQLDKNCQLLSRACGQDGECQYCRGIYTGCGPILYYKWTQCPGGHENLVIYHLPFEDYTTEASWNPFADVLKMTFP